MASPPYSAFLVATPFLDPKPPLRGPFRYCRFPSIHSSVAPSLEVSAPPGRATRNNCAPCSSLSRPREGENVDCCSGAASSRGQRPREACFSWHRTEKYPLGSREASFLTLLVVVSVLRIGDRLSLLSWLLGKLMFPPLSSYWLSSAVKAVI